MRLRSDIQANGEIQNIIFDFGGVICDIDVSRTEQKFVEFGEPVNSDVLNENPNLFQELVAGLEKGKVSEEAFVNAVQRHYIKPPSYEKVIEAWNALLDEIPDSRIRLLEKVKDHYQIYILSNTNFIHYRKYLEDFRKKSGYKSFEDIFRKFYLSCEIGMIKPGPEIYQFVINDAHLDPAKTLFVDDTPENVEGAVAAGLKGYYLKKEEDIVSLFE